jgi:hypothetical protein
MSSDVRAAGLTETSACKFTDGTNSWDMSSLTKKEGYTIKTADATYMLNVCGPTPACAASQKDVAVVAMSGGNCTSWGQASLEAWDRNPSKNGIYTTYYHGDLMPGNTVQHFESRIYFECNATHDSGPSFEHMYPHSGDEFMAHFTWATPLACTK